MIINDIILWLEDNDIRYSFNGSKEEEIQGFSSLTNYKKGTITWVKNRYGYVDSGKPTEVACAIVQDGIDVNILNAIYVDASKEIFFGILRHFWGEKKAAGSIGAGVVLSETVIKDDSVIIGCNCSIIGDVHIGANTKIENNVVIQGRVNIGNNCIIHSGTVIGCDGYGYYFDEDGKVGKVEHFGGVVIEDQVEIGANACVDRGTIDDTVIGFGSKVDNLVHIAHNVQIGKNVCVVAGAVICGSAKLKDGVYVAPGGIIKNQLEVGENAFIGLGAVATKEVEEGMVVIGVPATPMRKVKKGDK